MASSLLEPPCFISENKTIPQYKKDLERWSKLTTLKPELQAEMVLYKLEGHPSNSKEKVETRLGDSLTNNANGIVKLLKFFSEIYGEVDMADAYDKYVAFKNRKIRDGESIQKL